MGQRAGVFDVLHCDVRGAGEHLAVSLYGLRERRRRLSDTVHHSSCHHWEADVLYGDGFGAIYQSRKC